MPAAGGVSQVPALSQNNTTQLSKKTEKYPDRDIRNTEDSSSKLEGEGGFEIVTTPAVSSFPCPRCGSAFLLFRWVGLWDRPGCHNISELPERGENRDKQQQQLKEGEIFHHDKNNVGAKQVRREHGGSDAARDERELESN